MSKAASFRVGNAERNLVVSYWQYHESSDVAKKEAEEFKALFATAVRECSPVNIQACCRWIIQHIVTIPALVDAFGAFLNSLSAAFIVEKHKKDGLKKAEIKMKLWPIIFVVNELLHTTKFRQRDRKDYEACISGLRVPVINLVKDLAHFSHVTSQKHFNRLETLVSSWHKKGYFDKAYLETLRIVIASEGTQLPAESKEAHLHKKRTQEEPDRPRKKKKLDPTKGIQILGDNADNIKETGEWALPEWHGGRGTAWHMLPAASWLSPLENFNHDLTRGMRKRLCKPIHFRGAAVSKSVSKAVLKLLQQADDIYNPQSDDGKQIEYDELGCKMEIVKVGKGPGGKLKKHVKHETYYGWSTKFLDEMYNHPQDGFIKKLRRNPQYRSSSSYSDRSSHSPRIHVANSRPNKALSRSPSRPSSSSGRSGFYKSAPSFAAQGSNGMTTPGRAPPPWNTASSPPGFPQMPHVHSGIMPPPPPNWTPYQSLPPVHQVQGWTGPWPPPPPPTHMMGGGQPQPQGWVPPRPPVASGADRGLNVPQGHYHHQARGGNRQGSNGGNTRGRPGLGGRSDYGNRR